MKKKKEKTGKSSAAVEVNRVLTDKETTPNGNIKFEIEKELSLTDGEVIQPIFKWKFMTLSSKKLKNSNFNTIYKKCLGVYQCPDCNFVEAPRQPIKKTINTPPLPSRTKCPIHETSILKYVPCECRIIIEEKETSWSIKHMGTFWWVSIF